MDGINAERHAEDYRKVTGCAGETLEVRMAPGGGFAAILSK